ncbi:MAG: hypothetical protein RL885_03390 [Planctomycetota bacterium]
MNQGIKHHWADSWAATAGALCLAVSTLAGCGGGGGVAGAVDQGTLDTTITQSPADRTSAKAVTVQFQASGPVARIEGRLDGGSWGTIQSPWTSPNLKDGEHVLRVRAVNANGDADPTPAEVRWTVDTKGPSILLSFPGKEAFTTGSSSALFGLTEDLGVVESVTIDGAPANGSSDFASWRLRSNLSEGDNTIEIAATDDLGNRSSRTVMIRNDALMGFVKDVSIDRLRSQAIVAATMNASNESALFQVDLSSGMTTLLSGPGVGSGPELGTIHDVFVENNGNRAFVSSATARAILAVDLRTGDRSEVSGPNRGTGPSLFEPTQIVHDPFGGVVYAAEPINGKVFRIEVDSGVRSEIFKSTKPTAVAFEWDNRFLFVFDEIDNDIHWIGTQGGGQGVVMDGDDDQGPKIGALDAMSWDTFRRSYLYVSTGADRVLRVNTDNGSRVTIAEPSDGNGPLELPRGLTYDSSSDRVLVCDQNLNGLIQVAPGGGKRAALTRTSVGEGDALQDAWKMARRKGGTLLSLSRVSAFIRTVETSDAARGAIETTGITLESPGDIATASDGRAFVIDNKLDGIYEVDTQSGGVSLISGFARGEGIDFIGPQLVEVDSSAEKSWVFDSALQSILEVDLASGDRRQLSDAQHGNGPPLPFVRAMALDEAGGRLFVGDSSKDLEVYAIELATGDRTLVSDASQGGPQADNFTAMAFDVAGNRLLATLSVTNGAGALIGIDVSNGARTEISGPGRGEGFPMSTLTDIVFEADRGRCFVSSLFINAILIVDLESGDRAIFSK